MIDGLFKVKPVPVLPTRTSLHSLTEEFNNYFFTKIQKLRFDLQNNNLAALNMSVTIDQPPCQFALNEFATMMTEASIKDTILHSKPKSCVLDPIPTQVVIQSAEAAEALTGPITGLINASLSSGVFSMPLKKGVIRPSIRKQTADHELFSSYRPITNIPFLSKTLERVVATQTINYLIGNHLMAKLQSAYRRFHSTETALLRVLNDILSAKQEVVLVMLDMSAAVDTIDHELLLQRLQHRYGICGTVLNWFRSYLSNRTQSVRIQEVDSSDKILLYGVPQGSALGPLLFSLFFALLEDVILAHGLDAMMYADDTQLYIAIGSSDQRPIVLTKLELCNNDIMIWCTSTGLACNPDKTEIVHFTSRFSNSQDIPVININGCTIPPKPEARISE